MRGLDFERVGRLHELLLAVRVIRSAAPEGRLREVESQAADLMRSLNDDEREALESLLAGQGWDLHEYDDTMPGIARGGRVWMIVRRSDTRTPSLLTLEPAWRQVALSANETRAVTTYWFTFIWLLLMSLMYERIQRPISAVSDYVAAVVDRDELEQRLDERLERLRSTVDIDNGLRLPIAEALLRGDERPTRRTDIRRRVRSFLASMELAGMIERLPSPEAERYRQSLLCAVQINELYSYGLIHLVPTDQTLAEMDRFLVADRSDAFPDEPGAGSDTLPGDN